MEIIPNSVHDEQSGVCLQDALHGPLGSIACQRMNEETNSRGQTGKQNNFDVHANREGDDDEEDDDAPTEDPTTCLCGNDGDHCNYPDCQNGAYHGVSTSIKYIDPECHHWKPLIA